MASLAMLIKIKARVSFYTVCVQWQGVKHTTVTPHITYLTRTVTATALVLLAPFLVVASLAVASLLSFVPPALLGGLLRKESSNIDYLLSITNTVHSNITRLYVNIEKSRAGYLWNKFTPGKLENLNRVKI